MNILFIISSMQMGGAERVLSTLANTICTQNKITILRFDTNLPFYEIDQNVKILSTNDGVNDRGFFGNLSKRFGKILAIRKILKTSKFDVVISFLDTTNILVLLANIFLNNKIIISEHSNYTLLHSYFFRVLRRLTYPFSNALTVLSKFDYKHYSYVKNKIIMPNPMFNMPFYEFKKENLILLAGRLIKLKGVDTFLRSLALVDKNLLSNFKVVIAGDGDERENLQKLAKELNLKVEFLGFVKNICEYYSKAKIVVCTSRLEGFPCILVEAIYFECARLATNCPTGPSELIKDGYDGFLAKVDNTNEIAKKLEILLKNNDLRQKFIKNANLRKDEFKAENIARRWIELINKVVKNESIN